MIGQPCRTFDATTHENQSTHRHVNTTITVNTTIAITDHNTPTHPHTWRPHHTLPHLLKSVMSHAVAYSSGTKSASSSLKAKPGST